MKTLLDRPRLSMLLLLLAWTVLFARQFIQVGWLGGISPLIPLLVVLLAILLVLFPPANRRVRVSIIGTGVLVLVSSLLLFGIRDENRKLREEWRHQESQDIASVLAALGERIQNLLDLSTSVGEATKRFLLSRPVADHEGMETRLEAFRELGALSEQIKKGELLPAGTEIGIQLFDEHGNRIAWAGWPQAVEPLDAGFIASSRELVYSRQVSLYRILTHIIPIYGGGEGDEVDRLRGDREKRGTVLVDMPLEVNYKVNNKFLKSSSLADDIAGGEAANIRFNYYAADAGLSATIGGFERRPEDRPRPKKRTTPSPDDERASPDTERQPSRSAQEAKERTQARTKTTPDTASVFSTLPSFVEPLGSISGSQTAGLSGRAVVRSPLGNALFNVTVVGRPFTHYLENRNNSFLLVANLLALLALLIGFAVSLNYFPERISGPLHVVKALYLVAILTLVRYSLLWFQPTLLTSQLKVFEPAVFATPILGGLMRSAGDLLITAVFFVTALYGVLRIARETEASPEGEAVGHDGWLFVVKGFVAACAIVGVFELARRFIGSVVLNANPRLVGETVKVFQPEVTILHLSAFLMVTGIFLAGMICVWGVYRVKGKSDTGKASILAAVVVVTVSLVVSRWDLAFISLLVLLFIVFAPRVVQREDLVSIVITAFCFVIIVSAAAYVFFNQEYQGLRRTFIQEKVAEVTHPSDNWKVFILEDILENLSQDKSLHQALREPVSANVQRLAFDVWADSPLSLLGYSSAIYIFDEADSLVSRFAVEMPYRITAAEPGERMETTSSEEWVVLDLTTQTPQGAVRFYRGIANLKGYGTDLGGVLQRVPIGKIVVDVPFFFENLAWAARTGPQTPEVLRNIQEGGIAPRLEETEAILLAKLKGERVLESSSEVLPVGHTIERDVMGRAIDLDWPLLKTTGSTYRFLAQETDESLSYLLAGFPVPSPGQHVLRWSTILSLYFFFTVAFIVLIIILKRLPVLGEVLPTLTPGRQLGFQQKLLGSFLIVALLPAVILGVFSVRMIKERFVQENKNEAVYKASSAEKALKGELVGELHDLLDRHDLRSLIDGELPPFYVHDPSRRVMVFKESELPTVDTGLDFDKRRVKHLAADAVPGAEDDRSAGEYLDLARRLVGMPPEQVFVHWAEGEPYLGVLSYPISLVSGEEKETVIVYCARVVDGEILGAIADQIGADVSLFDGGELVSTSREGLLSGGFISSTMSSDAFVGVCIMGVDQSLVTERAGRYRYQVAYIPIQSMEAGEYAAIGVPLLFRPESYSVEVEKATSIVLSLFALLSAATIGLGLLLARGIFEPLKGLLEATKRIGRGDFSFKLPSKRHDEIGTVVEAFNEMTSQVSTSQAALEERRKYLEVILFNIGTGVITTDSDERIRAVNNAAARILGIQSADLVGKTTEQLVNENVLPSFFSRLGTESGPGWPHDSSEVDIIKDGHKRTIKYMKTGLSTEGRHLGTVFVFEDLTELISSKKLSAWVEMARQIAHEIKNPLTPIKLSTQFMARAHEEKSDDFDKIFKESSDTIIHQVEVLRNIASEFSSFGRLQQLDLSAHRIVPLLRDIVSPYQKNTFGVIVSFDIPNGEIEALVDPEALRRICSNLIENAMEAMPGGGTLEISCGLATYDGQDMRISFTDTGPGLSEDVEEKLFEPYFSTKTTGTGLGLAICRSLSREMGGDVTVENLTGGRGVEAILYLKPA
ncbi:MAG: PAS domain S-box protein [Candidatus Latescibacterota bacterium]|nr:MAG: PAS domain S-box protein [Candidatus Latescibacterota bacterium]